MRRETQINPSLDGSRATKRPAAAVGNPSHDEPNPQQVGTLSDGSCFPPQADLHSPTEAGFPVTWCWLTLTGASRAAQGTFYPSTPLAPMQVFLDLSLTRLLKFGTLKCFLECFLDEIAQATLSDHGRFLPLIELLCS